MPDDAVTDWSGHEGTASARRYRAMAAQFGSVSPSYERLALGVADDADVLALLDTVPAPKRQPNLLLGAVRLLDGPVDSWPAFRDFVLGQWPSVSAVLRERRTQTNEPLRCASLLPVLAGLDGPLALLEVGASAGLCLLPDRYAYRYDDGPVLGDSPLVLECATSGPVPVPTSLPTVGWRAGMDLAPVGVADPADVHWLRSLIWPEETHRVAVLDAALAIARREPPRVVAGDLTTSFADLAAEAPCDHTLVVFHSAVLAYLSTAERTRFADQVARVREHRRVVWLSNEGSGVVADHPRAGHDFVLAVDGRPVALTDGHGGRLAWLP